MPTPRTMLTNVRAALRNTTQAWHDVHSESDKNRHAWRSTHDSFRKKLRDSLLHVFQSNSSSALFRETLRSRYPDTLPLVMRYSNERNEALQWLAKHPDALLTKQLQKATSDKEMFYETTRRSSPALHNHMYQIEGLTKEAIKNGLPEPAQSYELDPDGWLEFIQLIELRLKDEEAASSMWDRLTGKANRLHEAARKIEKSTREGFPTMMLHVKESLDLQRKITLNYRTAVRAIEDCNRNIEKHQYHIERLAELDSLGETGYIIAHAKDDVHIKAIVDCLDSEYNGTELSALFTAASMYTERQTGIEMAHAMLSGWNETLQQADNVLLRKERDTTEYHDDPIGDMCLAARKGSIAVQRWLLTIVDSDIAATSPVLNEGPLDTHRMITMLREMDNKVVEANARFATHPAKKIS